MLDTMEIDLEFEPELLQAVDELVGSAGRDEFIARAVRRALDERRNAPEPLPASE
jgi:metal-responsive CopG/Arc/MetJ family transcriptional regulator